MCNLGCTVLKFNISPFSFTEKRIGPIQVADNTKNKLVPKQQMELGLQVWWVITATRKSRPAKLSLWLRRICYGCV
jgi:hypothetical protein